NEELLKEKLEALLHHHNTLLRGYGAEEFTVQGVFDSLMQIAGSILQYAAPVWKHLHAANANGAKILFEGAQGTMLDVDHGTYPFVTSSDTVAASAASGAGVGPRTVGYVLGITKAYT